MKTIVGLFDNIDHANRAVTELQNMGVRRDDISIVRNKDTTTTTTTGDSVDGGTKAAEGAGTGAGIGAALGAGAGLLAGLGLLAIPGIGPILAAGPIVGALTGAGIGAATGGIIGGLIGLGIPEEDAAEYEEGVRRGGTLVTAKVDDALADRAAAIFDRHNAVDMKTRADQWRAAGWKNTRSTTQTTTDTTRTAASTARPSTRAGEQSIPVVEESINVGKRQVQGGRVRVYSHMTETPVSEQVRLRQEQVKVERRPADRPATEADLRNFKEGTIEMRETSEEAVVQKNARVTGEVVVRKDVDEKTETVRDTVRKTDVKVDRVDDSKRGNSPNAGTTRNTTNTTQGGGPACNT